MDKDIAQAMDDLDDAVQVSYCRMFNNGHNTKAVVTNRWCGSHDMEVVKKGLDLLVKYLAMERKAEQASKEV
jgi:hypothetical protein